jgi:hypothetical protein
VKELEAKKIMPNEGKIPFAKKKDVKCLASNKNSKEACSRKLAILFGKRSIPKEAVEWNEFVDFLDAYRNTPDFKLPGRAKIGELLGKECDKLTER